MSLVNFLGTFETLDQVWESYPEGGKEGDYTYVADEVYLWDKYIINWRVAEPAECSEQRPIEVLSQEGMVEYSENYINYLGTFDTIEQAWEAYPEGGKEGDYILVGGEKFRWNKYTENWGDVDPEAETPARPVATLYGDLHVYHDLVVGEEIIAKIFGENATKWVMNVLSIDNNTLKIAGGSLQINPKTLLLYATKEYVDEAIANLPQSEGGISEELLNERLALYATKKYVDNAIAGLSGGGGGSDSGDNVKLTGAQDVGGVKNFKDGMRVADSPLITYDPNTRSFFFDGNIIISGDMAIRALLGALDVPTIMDAIAVDGSLVVDRSSGTPILKINPDYDFGGIDEQYLKGYLDTNEYATKSDVNETLGDYATKEYVTEATGSKWVKPIRLITANTTLTTSDYMAVITTKTKVTITLPSSSTAKQGQAYEIFGRNSAGMTLTANKTIYRAQGSSSTSHDINAGYFHAMVTYDGTYWLLSITENS